MCIWVISSKTAACLALRSRIVECIGQPIEVSTHLNTAASTVVRYTSNLISTSEPDDAEQCAISIPVESDLLQIAVFVASPLEHRYDGSLAAGGKAQRRKYDHGRSHILI